MEKDLLDKIIALRKKLHEIPERSLAETKTKQTLMQFLQENTTLLIVDRGKWFYAVRKADVGDRKAPVAFRADMDAVCAKGGQPGHYCGHDGHSSILAGLALYLDKGKTELNRDVYFIFQPAEETGQGAKLCLPLLEEKKIGEIYGLHNIPGYPLGEVLLCKQVFACASKGLILDLHGKQSHAAYPEQGINPGYLIAEIVNKLPIWCEDHKKGLTMASIIEMKVGSENFGISAGNGRLCLTLRAHYQEDLEMLTEAILAYARQQAETSGITMEVSETDAFPDTVNDTALTEKLEQLCIDHALPYTYLPGPMRWSEDFGWYQKKCRGVFFGIGAGEETPGLHTESYCYPEALLEKAGMIWETIIMHR